jgi:hypothetical protein
MSPRIWPPALDWRDSRHSNPVGLDDCVLCGRLTPLLSERGEPCHKTCAESWFEAHPDAWEFYERRRDHESTADNSQASTTNGDGRQATRRVHTPTLTLPDAA